MVTKIQEESSISFFDRIFTDKIDSRINDWPLMSSPMYTVVIIAIYLYFVLKFGPKFMEKRTPYNLKEFIIIYNLAQILSCAYIVKELLIVSPFLPRFWECHQVKNDKDYIWSAKICYLTLYVKFAELIETVCFVLRKKQNQITTLHVSHHCVTIIAVWLITKYITAGSLLFLLLINNLVHVPMYSYYLVALLGGRDVQKKLVPIKKLMTIIQMAQFVAMLVQIFIHHNNECAPPLGVQLYMSSATSYVFYKFYDFFKTSYLKRNKKQLVN